VYAGGLRYQPRFHLSAARQRELRCLSAGGLLKFRTRDADAISTMRSSARVFLQQPSLRRFQGLLQQAPTHSGLALRQAWRLIAEGRAYNPDDAGTRLLAFVEQPPRSDSRVSLSSETDAVGIRRATLDWKLGEQELRALLHLAEAVKATLEQAGLARVTIDHELQALDPAFLDRGWDNFHHMGTARMGESRSHGVVDSNLAMFDAVNGYICGCAVFPTGGFSNPTHTANPPASSTAPTTAASGTLIRRRCTAWETPKA